MRSINKRLNIFKLFIILFLANFVLNFLGFRVWAIDIKEMESKSDYELYNVAAEYFKSGPDQEAF